MQALIFIVPFLIGIYLFKDIIIIARMSTEEVLIYWSIGWIIPSIIKGIITGNWK